MRALAELLLRVAAQRWPESMREERAREWAAEMHQLGRWGRLRFACSLALSPPVNEDGVPIGWRETVPAFGRGLQPLLALFGYGLLCVAMGLLVVPFATLIIIQTVLGRPEQPSPTFNWPGNTISVAVIAVTAVAMFGIGRRAGMRRHVQWAHRGRLSRAGSAVVAPAFVIGAAVVVSALQRAGGLTDPRSGTGLPVSDDIVAYTFWAICFTVIAPVAVSVRHGWLIAALGTLVTLDVAAIIAVLSSARENAVSPGSAPLWFPVALFDLKDSGIYFEQVGQGVVEAGAVVYAALDPVRTCVFASAFVLGYAFAARVATPRPAPVSTRALMSARAIHPRPGWRGWVVVGAGLTLWTYALIVLTAAAAGTNDGKGKNHLWAHEIRQTAILIVVTGLVLAIAGRGAVLLPALLTGGMLWGIDSLFDALDATSTPAAVLAFGLGVIVVYTAWRLGRNLATDATAVRRALAGFAVFAAFCAPAITMHVGFASDRESAKGLPEQFWVASIVAIGLLAFAALLCASAVHGRTNWIWVTVIAVLAALGATLPFVWPSFAIAGLPLAVVTAWFTRPGGSARSVGLWMLILLGALIAAIPISYVQVFAGLLAGRFLVAFAGYSHSDAFPFLAGAILVGAGLATIVAPRLVPRQPTIETVTRPAHTTS